MDLSYISMVAATAVDVNRTFVGGQVTLARLYEAARSREQSISSLGVAR